MDTHEVFTALETKIRKLLQKYSEQLELNELFKIKEKELTLTVANQQQIIKDLKKEIEALKIAGFMGKEEDNREIKEKIDDLLREIDSCLVVLKR
ncbi:MAG: hypothetical protein JXA03_14625 [Bacteroidales bacterium]|nr:hypothetical protein [Bacteroidales bacterium]